MKKVWFYVSVVLAVIVVFLVVLLVVSNSQQVKNQQASITVCQRDLSEECDPKYGGYVPEYGYIDDAETAAIVGNAIINRMCEQKGERILPSEVGHDGVDVAYDSKLRLWRISKCYVLHRGGVVILNQDTGAVVMAYFQK